MSESSDHDLRTEGISGETRALQLYSENDLLLCT